MLLQVRCRPILQKHFYFMATVLQRFQELNLSHTRHLLICTGVAVREAWEKEEGDFINKTHQQEGSSTFLVNDYPDYWIPRMDYVIISYCAKQYSE